MDFYEVVAGWLPPPILKKIVSKHVDPSHYPSSENTVRCDPHSS